MGLSSRQEAGERPDVDTPPEPATRVSAYNTTPDRIVFAEDNNADGWISTDVFRDVEP